MSEQLLHELRKRIESGLKGGLGHLDLDAIILISQTIADKLPKLFIDIAQNITVSTDSLYGHNAPESLERLVNILDLLPIIENEKMSSHDMELIPTFELDQEDHVRVAQLCAQMRKIIFSSSDFDQPHKRRLLDRIAAIEHQIEQPRGIFDIVRGGMDDLGETLGKFGTNIKPLTDRMKEVVEIVRKGTKAYDQIPSPEEVKRLPAPDDTDEASP